MSGSYRQILWTIVFTIVGSSPARADYHYASHEGSDEYPYTSWETAADSIWKAIDASSPHDTVFISSGEWLETVETGVYDSVAIIGMGIDSTFWNGDTYRDPILMIDYGCSVEHITFCHLDGYNALFGMPYAGVIIRNCRFRQSAYAIQASGGHTEITNCIFDTCRAAIQIYSNNGDVHISNNIAREIQGAASGAIGFTGDSVVVERNIMFATPQSPGYDGIGGTRTGIRRAARNNVVMYPEYGISVPGNLVHNNTVIDDFIYPGHWSVGMIDWDGQRLFNNSITGFAVGIELGESSWIDYNDIWDNHVDFRDGNITDSIGNIYREPMFVNPDSGDFRLQAFSPLIDAGDPDILDVDGTRSDIGAYGGPRGAFYEYIDLPPRIPDSLSFSVIADTIFLFWKYNHEADFDRYQVHRDTVSGFEPGYLNLIGEPDTSYYVDIDISPNQDYYYRIAALDNQGNLSDYSSELAVLLTRVFDGAGAEIPYVTSIETNYPNPFNSQTVIVYNVADLGPIPAEITIDIYDILGRRVRTLINERKEVGRHRETWNGRGDNGEDLPSGVYFVRISQWGLEAAGGPRKVVLVK